MLQWDWLVVGREVFSCFFFKLAEIERSSENIGRLVVSVLIPSRTFWCVQWWPSRCVWWKIAQISMLQCHPIGRVHCSCCYARVIWRVNWYSCVNPGTALDRDRDLLMIATCAIHLFCDDSESSFWGLFFFDDHVRSLHSINQKKQFEATNPLWLCQPVAG